MKPFKFFRGRKKVYRGNTIAIVVPSIRYFIGWKMDNFGDSQPNDKSNSFIRHGVEYVYVSRVVDSVGVRFTDWDMDGFDGRPYDPQIELVVRNLVHRTGETI
jgi:hypothetical protein